MPTWILIVQWITHLILVLLVALSVWSVSIMVDRKRVFQSARAANLASGWSDRIAKAGSISELGAWANQAPESPIARTVQAVLSSHSEKGRLQSENVDRAVKSLLNDERLKLEKGLTVLATLGANAPFIGLLGTVLGIIQAFGQLAQQNAGTQTVMAGISEALIATAVGLFVAIPAVVAYNVFARQMKELLVGCDSAKDALLARFGGEK